MNHWIISCCLTIFLLIASCQPSANYSIDEDITEIEELLNAQLTAWNTGKIDGFMEGYWNSDELRFCGSSGTKYGWNTLKDMYERSFPNRDDMGTLHFDLDTFYTARYPQISVDGRWTIERYDTVGGHFVLLFDRNNQGEWVIIEDHTW